MPRQPGRLPLRISKSCPAVTCLFSCQTMWNFRFVPLVSSSYLVGKVGCRARPSAKRSSASQRERGAARLDDCRPSGPKAPERRELERRRFAPERNAFPALARSASIGLISSESPFEFPSEQVMGGSPPQASSPAAGVSTQSHFFLRVKIDPPPGEVKRFVDPMCRGSFNVAKSRCASGSAQSIAPTTSAAWSSADRNAGRPRCVPAGASGGRRACRSRPRFRSPNGRHPGAPARCSCRAAASACST